MPTLALVLVLAAASAHAGWNYLAKTLGGGPAFAWTLAACSASLTAPVGVVALVVTGGFPTSAAILIPGSALLHSVYAVLLQRGYLEGDLSFVYPFARGTGPLLAGVTAIAVLGERPSPVAVSGAALIVLAVLALAVAGERHHRPTRAAVTFAALTGVLIAGYTLWDAHAVDEAALNPLAYFWTAEVGRVLILGPAALANRDTVRSLWSEHRGRMIGAGAMSGTAYLLVLYALTMAPVSYVAPTREVSILIGAALGTQVLAEGQARTRLLAALAVVAGIVALALG